MPRVLLLPVRLLQLLLGLLLVLLQKRNQNLLPRARFVMVLLILSVLRVLLLVPRLLRKRPQDLQAMQRPQSLLQEILLRLLRKILLRLLREQRAVLWLPVTSLLLVPLLENLQAARVVHQRWLLLRPERLPAIDKLHHHVHLDVPILNSSTSASFSKT